MPAITQKADNPRGARELNLGTRMLGVSPAPAAPVAPPQGGGTPTGGTPPSGDGSSGAPTGAALAAADAPQPNDNQSGQQGLDAQDPNQPSAQGNPDQSLTGEETGEQLAQIGYESKNGAVHERVRTLARERNRFRQENDLLRQELLKNRIVPQNGAAPAPAANASQVPGPPPFERPAPAPDASDEEKLDFLIEKKAHEKAWQQTMRFGQELIQALAPALKGTLETQREKEWSQLDASFSAHGTSREELEPVVNALLAKEPHRSLRSATFDVMDRMNLLGQNNGAPAPAPVTNPGQTGKPRLPGRAQAAPAKEPTQKDAIQAVRERVAAGDGFGAGTLLGNALLKRQSPYEKR